MNSQGSSQLKVLLFSVAALVALVAVFAGTAESKRSGPKTIRISVKESNHKDPGTSSDFPAISSSGRYVAFESFGKLVGKDKDMQEDVYVYDREQKKRTLVSVKSNGKTGSGVGCGVADISPNGRYVSFACEGELADNDDNDKVDIYRHDRKTKKTILISLTNSDQTLNGVDDDSEVSGVADDGKVAWDSLGAFVTSDTNGSFDTYVRDPGPGTTKRASLDYQGNELPDGDGAINTDKQSKVPISGNGRYVAFVSDDIATADSDYGNAVDRDVFVRDLKNDRTKRISLRSNGNEADSANNAPSDSPSISSDGRYVAFVANGTTVFSGADTNNADDIYVRDTKNNKTNLVSVKSDGTQPPALSANQFPEISPNGRFVAWDTYSNFGGGSDPGNFRDVYRRDLKDKKTLLISQGTNGERVDTNQLADPANSHYVTFSSMGKLTSGSDPGPDFDVFLRGPVNP